MCDMECRREAVRIAKTCRLKNDQRAQLPELSS
jgi:hypothetical protein